MGGLHYTCPCYSATVSAAFGASRFAFLLLTIIVVTFGDPTNNTSDNTVKHTADLAVEVHVNLIHPVLGKFELPILLSRALILLSNLFPKSLISVLVSFWPTPK